MRLPYGLLVLILVFIVALPIAARQNRLAVEPNDERMDKTGSESREVKEDIPVLRPIPVPTPLQRVTKDAALDTAYKDTFSILSEDNTCSRFFGGDASATYVFNKLAGQLRKSPLVHPSIGIRMSGAITYVSHHKSGLSYRLFEHATLNSTGPFYRKKIFPADRLVPDIGNFSPDTREARVLILLHELAHMMKGPDGQWLIPDDGGSPDQSNQNTAIIEANCGEQIKALKNRKSEAKPTEMLAAGADGTSKDTGPKR